MKIAEVSPEIIPYAKTGGLADVAGTLPLYLEKAGQEISIFMPLYKSVRESGMDVRLTNITFDVPVGNVVCTGHLWKGVLPGAKNIVEEHLSINEFFQVQRT